MGIAKLLEEGKLKLEDKVFDIISEEFSTYDKSVTIAQLLSHTSGLPDYFDEDKMEDFDNFKVAVPWYDIWEPKDYFQVFPREGMAFEPGSEFKYNNSGFYPLNRLPQNTATGHITEKDGWRTNIFNLPIVGGGDGGLFTTIEDLYKLWDGLGDGKLITTSLLEEFFSSKVQTQPESDSYYGYGVWIYDAVGIPKEEYIMGADAGISFKSAIVREKDLIYTVISNTGEGAWPVLKAIVGLGLYA